MTDRSESSSFSGRDAGGRCGARRLPDRSSDPRVPDAGGPRSGAQALGRGATPPSSILERRIIKTRVIITDAPSRRTRGARGRLAGLACCFRAGRGREGGARPGRAGRSSARPRAGPGHEDVMTFGTEYDTSFRCMGSDVRLLIGEPVEPGLPSPADAAGTVRRFLEDFDARLSRFRSDSELSDLNRDPAPCCSRLGALEDRGAGSRLGGRADGRSARPHARKRARAGGVRPLARRRDACAARRGDRRCTTTSSRESESRPALAQDPRRPAGRDDRAPARPATR